MEEIRFADGTVWDVATIKTLAITGNDTAQTLYGYAGDDSIDAGAGNDTIYAKTGNDTIDGNSGNDYVVGEDGNDILLGNLGNDILYGGNGNDTLDGGTGNDYLSGDAGSDRYLFGRDSGMDTLYDYDTTTGNQDMLAFGSNIDYSQLWFRHVDSNLEISIIGTNDKVTITNWYSSANYHVEQFSTADGKVLQDSQVENLVGAMAGLTMPTIGQLTLPDNYQAALAATLTANWL